MLLLGCGSLVVSVCSRGVAVSVAGTFDSSSLGDEQSVWQ